MITMGTTVPFFLLFHPFLSSQLSPGWDGTEDHSFAHREGEILDKLAWETVTLMAAFDALLLHAGADRARLTVFEQVIGEAAFTVYIFQIYAVDLGQSLLEFYVIIPVSDIHGADTAIQSAWSGQVFSIFHFSTPRKVVWP